MRSKPGPMKGRTYHPVPLQLFESERPRILNAKDLPVDWERDSKLVYCGRPRGGADPRTVKPGEEGWLGNPFDVREVGGKERAIAKFRRYIAERMLGSRDWAALVLKTIKGKQLVCFCVTPSGVGLCHARIYVAIEQTPKAERRVLLEQWAREAALPGLPPIQND